MRYSLYILLVLLTYACSNDLREVNQLFEHDILKVEKATNVEILYSDSARVKVMIKGKKLLRHLDKISPRQEFPEGVYVEFYDDLGNATSYLESKYALRKEKEELIYARDSVVLYNSNDEKLETTELYWDEKSGKIYTNKFVRITQPERGDTSYGIGFESDKDFSRFVIKQKYAAKMTVDEISEALEN